MRTRISTGESVILETQERLPETLPLNGSDFFQVLLDKHHRKVGLQGNVSRFTLDLNGQPDIKALEQSVNDDPYFRWLHQLRWKARWPFQLPVWRKSNQIVRIKINEHQSAETYGLPDALWQYDIKPWKQAPYALDLIYRPNDISTLVFTWNHSLLDSRGAELLLRYLGGNLEDDKALIFLPPEEEELPAKEQLEHTQKVKAFLFDGKETKTRLSLLLESKKSKAANRYHVIAFTADETQQIEENCKKYLVRFGKSPVYLATAIRSFNQLLETKGKKGDSFWVPIPQDQRRKGAWGPVLANQVSFLFYRLFPDVLSDMKATVDEISKQMIDQIRNRIPQSYKIMMAFSRRMPMWLYSYIVKSPTKGAFASFFFSDTGNSLDGFDQFADIPITDAVHYPPNAGYPGFTVVFMLFQGKLKVIVAHTETSADEKAITQFEKALRADLLSG